jgi:hypothetical protein
MLIVCGVHILLYCSFYYNNGRYGQRIKLVQCTWATSLCHAVTVYLL